MILVDTSNFVITGSTLLMWMIQLLKRWFMNFQFFGLFSSPRHLSTRRSVAINAFICLFLFVASHPNICRNDYNFLKTWRHYFYGLVFSPLFLELKVGNKVRKFVLLVNLYVIISWRSICCFREGGLYTRANWLPFFLHLLFLDCCSQRWSKRDTFPACWTSPEGDYYFACLITHKPYTFY